MPSPQDLAPAVLTFLDRHIGSLEELQLLTAVVDAPDRWWDAAAAGNELGVAPAMAARVLEHLARNSLMDIRITDDVRYQFRPATHQLGDEAVACVAAYRAQPLAVARAIAPRHRHVKDFADAFRIRRT